MLSHNLYQCERVSHVVLVVLQRLCNRLANGLQSSKMNHSVYLVFVKNLVHGTLVTNICLIERDRSSGNLFHLVHHLCL